jgi:hypothetical protein
MKKDRWPTIEELKTTPVWELNKHKFEELLNQPVVKKRKHKFNANPCEVDGIKFPSEKEAKRYNTLLFLRKKGFIGQLQLQVPFELNGGGTHSLKYVADFIYIVTATGEKIVEDAKGFRTREYQKKKRLMKKVHNIEIKEV